MKTVDSGSSKVNVEPLDLPFPLPFPLSTFFREEVRRGATAFNAPGEPVERRPKGVLAFCNGLLLLPD